MIYYQNVVNTSYERFTHYVPSNQKHSMLVLMYLISILLFSLNIATQFLCKFSPGQGTLTNKWACTTQPQYGGGVVSW